MTDARTDLEITKKAYMRMSYVIINNLKKRHMKKIIVRNYNMTDADLIEDATTKEGHLTENLVDFTNFDTTLDESKLTELRDLLTEARAILSDNIIIDNQAEKTEIVINLMEQCRKQYGKLSYFIKKAFPESPATRNKFGENDYSKVRKTQSKMIFFMEDLAATAVKYSAELISAGAKQEYIDRTVQLSEELTQANKGQEMYMDTRPMLTEERIIIFNKIWGILQQLSKAAKIIYEGQIAKMKLFLIPQRSVKHKDDTQHIGPGELQISIDEGIEQDLYIKLENTGTVNLTFYVADTNLVEAPQNALTLAPEQKETILSNDISNQTYGMLMAQNNAEEEGTFTVKLME